MNVVGKDCDVYVKKSSMGKSIFGGWNGILLYTKVVISMGTSEIKAIEFEENVSLDPELFSVPSDHKVQKI